MPPVFSKRSFPIIRLRKLGLVLLVAGTALAEPATNPNDEIPPLAQFNRCYGTITRMRLQKSHRLYAAVKNGALTPTDACMQVLAGAAFDHTPEDAEEKVATLQTFSDFHRTWFSSDNYFNSLPLGEIYGPNRQMRDPGEAAHYVTRAVFGQGIPFSSILLESTGMVAVRAPGAAEDAYPGKGMPPLGYRNRADQVVRYDPPWHLRGDVVGVQRMVDNPAYAGAVIQDPKDWAKPIPLYAHFGGGLIGSQSFLMLNFGRGVEDNDGGLKMPRRWSKAILQDLMCRDIPAVRSEDVQALVEPASELPFRKQASCMQCHGSLDPMAATARNIRYLNFPMDRVAFWDSIHMVAYDVTNAAYATQPPVGALVYRSFDGDLINRKVTGLQQLGEAIAAEDDLYVCAASRYFELFTGLRVSLQDLGDPNNPKLSAGDLYYRDLVIRLGREFKEHQNVMTLVKDIIETDFYKLAGMRRAVSVQ